MIRLYPWHFVFRSQMSLKFPRGDKGIQDDFHGASLSRETAENIKYCFH